MLMVVRRERSRVVKMVVKMVVLMVVLMAGEMVVMRVA